MHCYVHICHVYYYFDVKLPVVLSGLIVSESLRKSSLNVTIFLQNFSLNSIVYIYLLVKFLFSLCFSSFSCLFATSYGE